MNIALVDDEQSALDILSEMISQELLLSGDSTHKIDYYHSGEEFLQFWQPGSYDLIVLDIFMGKLLGIDVAHNIRETDKEVHLVFCTSSNEFACESYEVGAKYYLHKPFSNDSIKRMLNRLDMEIMELSRAARLPGGQSVLLRSILYAQHSSHTAQIHLKNGEILCSRLTHGELEALLCEQSYFCCCSKGVIVNFHEVSAQKADTFVMSDGSLLPISRRKAKAVQESYAKFHFDKLRKEVRT